MAEQVHQGKRNEGDCKGLCGEGGGSRHHLKGGDRWEKVPGPNSTPLPNAFKKTGGAGDADSGSLTPGGARSRRYSAPVTAGGLEVGGEEGL